MHKKVLGRDNPADLMTKYLDQNTIDRHSGFLHVEFPGGRASTAPTLHNVAQLMSLCEAIKADGEEALRQFVQPATWAAWSREEPDSASGIIPSRLRRAG